VRSVLVCRCQLLRLQQRVRSRCSCRCCSNSCVVYVWTVGVALTVVPCRYGGAGLGSRCVAMQQRARDGSGAATGAGEDDGSAWRSVRVRVMMVRDVRHRYDQYHRKLWLQLLLRLTVCTRCSKDYNR
jgi:hypothetical protein